MTNSVDPDQKKPTDLDLHCLLKQGMTCSSREELKATFIQCKILICFGHTGHICQKLLIYLGNLLHPLQALSEASRKSEGISRENFISETTISQIRHILIDAERRRGKPYFETDPASTQNPSMLVHTLERCMQEMIKDVEIRKSKVEEVLTLLIFYTDMLISTIFMPPTLKKVKLAKCFFFVLPFIHLTFPCVPYISENIWSQDFGRLIATEE